MEHLGLENTKENRKLLDLKIKSYIGDPEMHCPEIWAIVKEKIKTKEGFDQFVNDLKE
jgi:hypothetical protein